MIRDIVGNFRVVFRKMRVEIQKWCQWSPGYRHFGPNADVRTAVNWARIVADVASRIQGGSWKATGLGAVPIAMKVEAGTWCQNVSRVAKPCDA
jgi:hypothetical protein